MSNRFGCATVVTQGVTKQVFNKLHLWVVLALRSFSFCDCADELFNAVNTNAVPTVQLLLDENVNPDFSTGSHQHIVLYFFQFFFCIFGRSFQAADDRGVKRWPLIVFISRHWANSPLSQLTNH